MRPPSLGPEDETYPALACDHIGFRFASGESKQKNQKQAACLLTWSDSRGINAIPSLRAEMLYGFGIDPTGEDRFDALVGVLSMIDVVTDRRVANAPDDPKITQWEGWILGRTS